MDGGRRTADAARRTDIWITKSLPELSSGETKSMADNQKLQPGCPCVLCKTDIYRSAKFTVFIITVYTKCP